MVAILSPVLQVAALSAGVAMGILYVVERRPRIETLAALLLAAFTWALMRG